MMSGILTQAAAQGYAPQVVVCAGETRLGRPSPLPMWQVLADLDAWPAWRCVKLDDSPVGIEEGRDAGAWTIGISASGNGVGLDLDAWTALAPAQRATLAASAEAALRAVGADYVIESVAEAKDVLIDIDRRIAAGERPRG
jgi:phosphonoacetaldehyde hydrolase